MADRASFDEFYLGTREGVLRQLTAMTTDPDLAGDVVQEAYTRAWQRWARVSGLDDPAAWVRTVAWRIAVSHFRRASVARRRLVRLGHDAETRPQHESDTRLDIEAALRRLTPEHRRVLVLHEMVGLTVLQIAEEIGVAEGTVKSRLFRARAHLVAALGPDYPAAVDEPPVSGEVGR
ncbi:MULTISPECIES: RNA polymerase sigma factor [unclassified Nocardioides]|uniref:RNA polymerase sigma factor n=1 Tax=unclassified Nocardioides TaxID=2615069 RepID=UPI0036159B51